MHRVSRGLSLGSRWRKVSNVSAQNGVNKLKHYR